MKEFTGFKHGINIGGWLSQCSLDKPHLDSFITENDIINIKEMGFDHIRLPVDYPLIESENGDIIEDGFKYIDNAADWCRKHGLNIIIDLHKTAGYAFSEADKCSSFFASTDLQKRFYNIWTEISKRYGRYEHTAFDLLNEIVDPGVCNEWNGIAEQAVLYIRKYAPYTPILIGGTCYNSINTVKDILYPIDDRIVYSFHFYEPYLFTHQGASWEKNMPAGFRVGYPMTAKEYKKISDQDLNGIFSGIFYSMEEDTCGEKMLIKLFDEAVKTAEERNVPLYCGEYGVINSADTEYALAWHKDMYSVFEKFGIGRALWCYKGMSFGLTDGHYSEVKNKLTEFI